MRVLLLSLLLFASCSSPTPPPDTHPATNTVKIRFEGIEGAGSGIPIHITPEGFTIVLTARHVAEVGAASAMRVLLWECEWPAVRVQMHPTLDLAAVWVQGVLPTVPLDYRPTRIGERVEGAGWLFGEFFTLSEGLISRPGAASVDLLPGASGGPLFRNGLLVGIVETTIAMSSPFGSLPIGASSDFVQISEAREWLRAILQ